MEVQLVANTEQIVDLGVEAALLRIVNNSLEPLYVKNNAAVHVRDADAFTVSAGCTEFVDFKTSSCRNLYLISAASAIVELTVTSVFRAIHRDALTANTETVVDFMENAAGFDIQNLSDKDKLYFSLDCPATVDGNQTIELQPGGGFTDRKTVQQIHLISAGMPRYQVRGWK